MSKQGRLTEARKHLQQTRTQHEQQRILLIQAEAQLLREAKLNRDAFEVLGTALEKQPDHPDLLYDHAMAAEKLNQMDVMEKNLRRLIQLKPDNAHAYNALGYSLADRNLRLDEARELVEKAAELKPEDPFIMDSLGWVYFRLGQHTKAIELLRRALALGNDPEIAAHLGEVLWTQGQREEARKVWQSALKQAPGNESLRDVMHKHQ
jgi:Flp pilus assembly protein TadD